MPGIALLITSMIVTGCGHLERRLDQGIESAGSKATGVRVELDDLQLEPLRGMAEISGLTVANPEGFQEPYAYQMDQVRVNLGMLSLLGLDYIVLDELLLDSPILTVETNGLGVTNLKVMLDWIQDGQPADGPEAPDPEEPVTGDPDPDEPAGEPMRITVRKLAIRGVSFRVLREDGTWTQGTLPTIELANVGGADGETVGGIGSVIVLSLARQMFIQLVAGHLGDVEVLLEHFDAEDWLTSWALELGLTDEQITQLAPVLDAQAEDLQGALAITRESGYLDLNGLTHWFTMAAEQASQDLVTALSPEQLAELDRLYGDLARQTRDTILNQLAAKMTDLLGLRPEQMEALGPALREQVRQRAALLSRHLRDPARSLEEFAVAYADLQDETHQILGEVLDPDQMDAWIVRQQAVQQAVQNVLLGILPR